MYWGRSPRCSPPPTNKDRHSEATPSNDKPTAEQSDVPRESRPPRLDDGGRVVKGRGSIKYQDNVMKSDAAVDFDGAPAPRSSYGRRGGDRPSRYDHNRDKNRSSYDRDYRHHDRYDRRPHSGYEKVTYSREEFTRDQQQLNTREQRFTSDSDRPSSSSANEKPAV